MHYAIDKSSSRVKYKYIIFSFLTTTFLFASVITWLFFHNFAVVIPGEVFRSRQLDAEQLEKAILHYHIQTIINLRGENRQEPWYQDEIKLSREFKVEHYDFPFSSKKIPSKQQIQYLVNVLNDAPKPLLFHCQSGDDRSGFAAIIALLVLEKPSLEQLKREVSWRYFVFSDQSIGRQWLRKYENFIQEKKLAVGKASLMLWLRNQK